MTRIFRSSTVATMVAGLLGILAPTPVARAAEPVNHIVLRINSRIATLLHYELRLRERQEGIMAGDLEEERRRELLEGSGVSVFEEIYHELLILSRADQLGLEVSEDQLKEIKASTMERMGLEDELAFEQALGQSGMTMEAYEQRLRNNALMQQVMAQEIQTRIEVEEEDLRRFYREHEDDFRLPETRKLREIIVLTESPPEPEAVAAAAEIRERVLAGEELATLIEPRAAAGTTTPVIDLGWVERDDLDPDLAAVAWELEDASVSEPVEGRGGLHILVLDEVRLAGLQEFEQVREQVDMRLRQERMETVIPAYMDELEAKSYIRMKLPPQAEGFQASTDRG